LIKERRADAIHTGITKMIEAEKRIKKVRRRSERQNEA